MLTGYLGVGPSGVLVLGVQDVDLKALSADQACTLDGALFGLPNLKILVTHVASQEAFYTMCRGMAAELQQGLPGIEVHEVHAPDEEVLS